MAERTALRISNIAALTSAMVGVGYGLNMEVLPFLKTGALQTPNQIDLFILSTLATTATVGLIRRAIARRNINRTPHG